jgi:hypothetical protein
MKVDQGSELNEIAIPARKPWIKPEIKKMRAGSAEQSPGSRVSDGLLETIGS